MNQKNKSFLFILVITAFLLYFGMYFLFYYFPIGDSWDFRNNLWGPSYLLLHNQNPYHIKLLFTDSNAVWLPPAIGLFSFLGAFPFETSRVLWLLINLTAFFIVCLLILQPVRSLSELCWILLLALFPSTIVNFTMGQFSIFSLFAMVFLAKFYSQIPPWITGLFLALLFTKPQLIIFCLPVFIFRLMLEKGTVSVLIQIIWIATGLLISSSPLIIGSENWIYQLIENLKGNTRWLQPNPYSFLVQQIGLPPLIGFFFFAIALSFLFYYSYAHNMYDSIILSMAITTLLSPFIWSWDFVLLLPLVISSYKKNNIKIARLIILLGFSAITLFYSVIKISGYNSDDLFIWVPPSILILLLLANQIENKFYNGA